MNFEDIKKLYHDFQLKYKEDAYKHISELLEEAKEIHKKDWLRNPTPGGDHEQSWRAFKGKNLEKLILYIIEEKVCSLGLASVRGDALERTSNSERNLSQVKRNLAIDYGECGLHLPDVDIVIYDPKDCRIIAVVSSKVTLRERIAQTGYWKLKLRQQEITKHIKVYFITPDEDNTLTERYPTKKGRAIVEKDLDGSYVLTTQELKQSKKVKLFEYFFNDLEAIKNEK